MSINVNFPASWKTSVAGFISLAAGFIVLNASYFSAHPLIVELAKYVSVGGPAAGLFMAKDSNVTGGTKANE